MRWERTKRNFLIVAMLAAVWLYGLWTVSDALAAAEAEWEPVGAGLDVSASDLFVDGEEMYAAHRDNGGLYMKYFDGSEWTELGGKLSAGNGYQPHIAVRHGVPYVSFTNDVSGQWGYISVKYYDWSEQEWRSVGENGFSDAPIIDSAIAFDNDGTLYAFYRKSGSGTPEVKAYAEDEHGQWAWRLVGDMSQLPLSPSRSQTVDMDVEEGVVFVAYYESPETGYVYATPVVARYDTGAAPAQWERLTGTGGSLANNGRSSKVSIDVVWGEPHIAYHASADAAQRTFVKKYHNGEWYTLGDFQNSYDPVIAAEAGHVYVSTRLSDGERAYANSRLVVRHYDGLEWSELGDALHASSGSAGLYNLRLQYGQQLVYAGFDDGIGRVYRVDSGVDGPAALMPPLLVAAEPRLASEAIEITFADDDQWRAAVTTVRAGNQRLTDGTHYTIAPGVITIMPDTLSAGVTGLRIEADGYAVALLFQPVRPETPQGLEVNRTGHSFVELGWQAVSDADAYEVYYREGDGAWMHRRVTDTTVRLTGLTNDAIHTFYVVSVADDVEGLPSEEIASTPYYPAGDGGKAWEMLGQPFDGLHPHLYWDGDALLAGYRNNGRAAVRSWDGSDWLHVGAPYVGDSALNSYDVTVAASGESDGHALYVGYLGHSGDVNIRSYDADSGEWRLVGGAAAVPAGAAKLAPIALYNGAPYVAYTGSDGRVYVRTYDDTDGWIAAGAGDGFGGEETYDVQLRIGGGVAYLAYIERSGARHNMRLATLDVAAGANAWQMIDTTALAHVIHWGVGEFLAADESGAYVAYPAFDHGGIALWHLPVAGEWSDQGALSYSFEAYGVSVAVDDGVPFIAYSDGPDNDYIMHVNKHANGHWYPVGRSIAPEAGVAHNLNVHSVNDMPRIMFYNGNYAVETHRFEYDWCSVTLRYANGTADGTLQVPCGEPVPQQDEPERAGYLFAGWHIGDEEYDFVSPVTGNVVLQAAWKPPAPDNFVAYEYGDGSVALRWDAVEQATGYKLYMRTEHGSYSSDTSILVVDTTYTFTGLTNGTRYYFTVTASVDDEDSDPAPEASELPRTVPGAPVITSATAGDGQVSIAFTAPSSDGGADIERYVVAWQDGGADMTMEGTASPIAVTGLANRQSYTFTVTAVNSEGEGAPSVATEPVMPYRTCMLIFSAMNDTEITFENVMCGEAVDEPEPMLREGYTFEGWHVWDSGERWDFSGPVEDNVWLNGQWSFDPTAIPAGEWNIIEATNSNGNSARVLDGNILYEATLSDGLLVVRKYVEREGWLAVGSPINTSGMSYAMALAVEDGEVFVVYVDGAGRLAVSWHDGADAGSGWKPLGTITDLPDYLMDIQLEKQGGNLFAAYMEGFAGDGAKVWRHSLDGGGSWLDITPPIPDVSGLKLAGYVNGALLLYGSGDYDSMELRLSRWADDGSPEGQWSEYTDLSMFPSPSFFSNYLLERDENTVYVGYQDASFDYRVLRHKDGVISDLGNPADGYVNSAALAVGGDEPYLIHSGGEQIAIKVYRDGAWRTNDGIVSSMGGQVSQISAGIGGHTRYIRYLNSNNESVTRFYESAVCVATFDSGEGGVVPTQVVRCGQPLEEPMAERPGYTLDGWFVGPEGNMAWNFASDLVVADVALYARWTRTSTEGPVAPTGLTVAAGDRQVTLHWEPVPDTVVYSVYMAGFPGAHGLPPITTVTGDTLTYTADGLTNGSRYYFVVAAANLYGESEYSSEISAVPAGTPGAPANVAARGKSGSRAIISFAAPIDDGGSPVTMYEVAADEAGITAVGTTETIEIGGLRRGVVYTFTVRARNAQGWGPPSAPSSPVVLRGEDSGQEPGSEQPGSEQEPDSEAAPDSDEDTQDEQGFEVLVNGKAVVAGTASTLEADGLLTTLIVLDADKLREQINAHDEAIRVKLRVDRPTDVLISELTGDIVKSMEMNQAFLDIEAAEAGYTLPAQALHISGVAAEFGEDVALHDIKVNIRIASPSKEQTAVLERVRSTADWAVVAQPVNFVITAEFKGSIVEVNRFNVYVERTIALPPDAQPGDVTTAVIVEADGTIRHAPTAVVQVDGRYYALIRTMNNSLYALVRHQPMFTDTAGHWSHETVSDMGARLIVSGVGNGLFAPDAAVTRVEFAAMLARGLGLQSQGGGSPFTDVSGAAWRVEAVAAAYDYGLIDGFADGTFRPDERITREQAMMIAANSMPLVGIGEPRAEETTLGRFTDRSDISAWARSAAAASVNAGLVTGKAGDRLAPLADVTRAEAAAIIRMLLFRSGLIDSVTTPTSTL